jgi:hypothetical protein
MTVLLGSALWADPGSNPPAGSDIVGKFVAATQAQAPHLRGVSMEVDIDASLPKLQKQGRLHALRFISRLGKITYKQLGFTGDNTIKKDVIARYLTAETQAQTDESAVAITPENYKFKYKGIMDYNGQQVHVFAVSPKKKAVGLFKGELWLDAKSYLPVREAGRFVKNPSVFLKKVDFVREFDIKDGNWLPKRIESTIDTRIVGKAELTVNFHNISPTPETDDSASLGTEPSNP